MQEKPESLQIEIDEAIARGVYTNFALISHGESEFVIDFLFLHPQTPRAKVHSRLVTSPLHAKRLLWALKENIDKFESRYGPIPNPESPSPEPGKLN